MGIGGGATETISIQLIPASSRLYKRNNRALIQLPPSRPPQLLALQALSNRKH